MITKYRNWILPAILIPIVLLRLLLINVNSAEWGDSYRILRASNFIQHFSYPTDEKRPPLFSILLAIRPNSIDAVFWGRLFMLAISFLSLLVFYKLCQKILSTKRQRLLALIFLALNPVYLYWSLRIYADVPFSLLVMLCFYVFELWREKLDNKDKSSMWYMVVMGIICGLGILTRFEGYLLVASTLGGLIYFIRDTIVPKIKKSLAFFLVAAVVVLPWLIYRNPLTSSYFEEPAGRKYDLKMFLTYVVSYLFVLGKVPAAALIGSYILTKPAYIVSTAVKKYPHVAAFVALESILILLWPAAVPRLFVPVIPFLVIALVKAIDAFFVGSASFKLAAPERVGIVVGLASTLLTAIYFIAEKRLGLQFLGPNKFVLLSVVIVSLVCTLSLFLKNYKVFILSSILSLTLLAGSTIYLHKDIYRTINNVAAFSLREARGKYIYNDTSGICDWYLKGGYIDLNNKNYLTKDYLYANAIDYVIITNEHNPDLDIDLKKRPYLSLTKESKHARGGRMFFTWLVKVQK